MQAWYLLLIEFAEEKPSKFLSNKDKHLGMQGVQELFFFVNSKSEK